MSVDIKQILSFYRNRHKMSQRDIATKLEVSQSQVSKWEQGIHVPSKLRSSDIRKRLSSD